MDQSAARNSTKPFKRIQSKLIQKVDRYHLLLRCDDNKYIFPGNKNCRKSEKSEANSDIHRLCHQTNNPCQCDYSSITKGLISCTVIAACTLSLSFLLIFSHIIINPYKYQVHLYITIVTVFLLLVGLIFILSALILLGSSLSYDLYQYHYNLNNRLEEAGMFVYSFVMFNKNKPYFRYTTTKR